jgi:hypothetical protein
MIKKILRDDSLSSEAKQRRINQQDLLRWWLGPQEAASLILLLPSPLDIPPPILTAHESDGDSYLLSKNRSV